MDYFFNTTVFTSLLVLSQFFMVCEVCPVSFNHTLSAILRGHWFIDRQWAEAHLPLVLSLIKGDPVSFVNPNRTNVVDRKGHQVIEQPFAIDPKDMRRYELYVVDERTWRYVANPNIPENSVGILPISGPITKYNGDCGEPGSIQRNTWLLDMDRRANIGSVILLLDTPGGEAKAATGAVTTIQRFSKPILSYVDGMNASLGMWYSSATQEVYLSNKMDEMGSIGSLVMFLDFRGALEKEGIKLHEIYAPQSVDKNKEYREAIKGNYELLEKDLEIHTNEFISFVRNNRPKAAATEKEWRTGKLFYAQEAVSLGLADGIRGFDQVISKAAWLAKRKKK